MIHDEAYLRYQDSGVHLTHFHHLHFSVRLVMRHLVMLVALGWMMEVEVEASVEQRYHLFVSRVYFAVGLEEIVLPCLIPHELSTANINNIKTK